MRIDNFNIFSLCSIDCCKEEKDYANKTKRETSNRTSTSTPVISNPIDPSSIKKIDPTKDIKCPVIVTPRKPSFNYKISGRLKITRNMKRFGKYLLKKREEFKKKHPIALRFIEGAVISGVGIGLLLLMSNPIGAGIGFGLIIGGYAYCALRVTIDQMNAKK